MEPQITLQLGTELRNGSYRVERILGSGGFGNTYVITNLNLDVVCAMKEFFMRGINLREGNTVTVSVPENRPSFDAQREKFKKEAQRLWKLKNDHIVKVHDLFEENGTVYYVMDFIDGESLSERLKRLGRPFTDAEVEPLLRQALDALESVHRQKIWHLDIKPANMMVDKQGHLYLIDFGASKQLRNNEGVTVPTSTALAYTPGYAPFEQIDQDMRSFGPWTDLYALGATLYKLLTDDTPPSSSNILAMGGNLQFPPQVSYRMQKLIAWMMNPAYTQRPQSAADVRKFLDESVVTEEETIIDEPVFVPSEETERLANPKDYQSEPDTVEPKPYRAPSSGDGVTIYPDTEMIEFQYTGASIPPPYHRSYEVSVTRQLLRLRIYCYDDLLYEGNLPFDSARFNMLIDTISSLNIHITPLQKSYATGGETLSLNLHRKGDTYLSVYSYGNEYSYFEGTTDANLYLLKQDIEKCIPGFSSLIAQESGTSREENSSDEVADTSGSGLKVEWWLSMLLIAALLLLGYFGIEIFK